MNKHVNLSRVLDGLVGSFVDGVGWPHREGGLVEPVAFLLSWVARCSF